MQEIPRNIKKSCKSLEYKGPYHFVPFILINKKLPVKAIHWSSESARIHSLELPYPPLSPVSDTMLFCQVPFSHIHLK